MNPQGEITVLAVNGLTLRDYFAAAALYGISIAGTDVSNAARIAYKVADDMLKERAK